MIALVRGTLMASDMDEVVIDVNGVGYRVGVVAGEVRGAIGTEVTLYTHLAVREDALTLYGFASAAAVSLFKQLVAVSGVGPKLAQAAIGTLGPQGVRRAVVTEDVAALTSIPGVGKKSASRLILELRERLGSFGIDDLPPVGTDFSDPRSEVRGALRTLGYGPAEIEQALVVVADSAATAEEQITQVLRHIGKR
jgi:Holliday junction DNA helicase RuvA